jgi:hypothetical protein
LTPRSHYVNTRRKLLCLILVASLALLSIVLISEQLISRHVRRSQQGALQAELILAPASGQVLEELDILTLDEWAEHESGDFSLDKPKDDATDYPVNPHPTSLAHADGSTLIEEGIFWSAELEAKVPPGPSDQEVQVT